MNVVIAVWVLLWGIKPFYGSTKPLLSTFVGIS